MTASRIPEVEEALAERHGAQVVAVEWWGPGDPTALPPAEQELVADAVAGRREQFAAGRHCAAAALAHLGIAPAPLVRRAGERAPDWPAEVWGSLSHTAGYAVAVVAHRAACPVSLGVDAEEPGRVGRELYRRLFTEVEQVWLADQGPDEAVAATTVFGLKECLYKAQYPLTGAWVGFEDVTISPEPTTGAWSLAPHTDLPALDAVRWPVVGWSFRREQPVSGSTISLTVVGAHPARRP